MQEWPRTVLWAPTVAMVIAPGSATNAFTRLREWAGVSVLVLIAMLQVVTIFIVAEIHPAFLTQPDRGTNQTVGRASDETTLRSRAIAFANARTRRTLEDAVILWGVALALIIMLQRRVRVANVLLAAALIAFAAVARQFGMVRGAGWPDTAMLLVLGVTVGAYLSLRRYRTAAALNAVSLALAVGALGFVVRQAVAVLNGLDVGRVTLGVLGSWNPAVEHWLARIDVFTLWWSFTLAAGLSVITRRSYAVTATVVILINVSLLLAGRRLISS